jgi:hypothetical protein
MPTFPERSVLMRPRPIIQALLLCSFVSFSAVADDDDDDDSGVPGFIKGPILHQIYDGVTDDLLTAGLGKTGLTGAAPGFVDPAKPTAAELRRHAIYSNYRALISQLRIVLRLHALAVGFKLRILERELFQRRLDGHPEDMSQASCKTSLDWVARRRG